MTNVSKLIHIKQPLPNLRFWDENKIGCNLFFIPETLSKKDSDEALEKFMKTQIKSYYHAITVPGIISNFLGRKLSSQKHYLQLKADMPNFIYNRTPGKQVENDKTNVFDMSGIIDDIMSLSKSRSAKQLFIEFDKLITSVIKDYPEDRKNYILIYGSPSINSESSDFLNLLIYISKLNGDKFKTKLDGVIYLINNKYYPIAIPDDKEENTLKFLRNIISEIKQVKDVLTKGYTEDNDETLQETKDKIIKLSTSKEDKSIIYKKIKEILHQQTTLTGTLDEKIKQLFKEENTSDITGLQNEINRKYNGNVILDIPHDNRVFDAQKIVGMDEVGNYNKQKTELSENVDELLEDLIHSTLENDPDVNIKVLSIKSKIEDNNKNRFKEFQVKIQHKDFGNTTNKPYTVSFRIPVPVNGKYVKIGGNNYILINQLFPKPIQKVSPDLVRFYTHFSVASLRLKNASLNAQSSFIELENIFVQQLKSVNKIKLENLTNDVKDEMSLKYGLSDMKDFKYSKMTITA